MIIKNKIAGTLLGFFFSLSMLFPGFVHLSHLFESHEHIACSDITQHVHEKKIDCEINDFQITAFDFPDFECPNATITPGFAQLDALYISGFSSETIQDFHLRGPPTHS